MKKTFISLAGSCIVCALVLMRVSCGSGPIAPAVGHTSSPEASQTPDASDSKTEPSEPPITYGEIWNFDDPELFLSSSLIFPIHAVIYEKTTKTDGIVNVIANTQAGQSPEVISALHSAVETLLYANPVYSPEETAHILRRCFWGIRDDPDARMYYSYIDRNIYTGKEFLDSIKDTEALQWAFAHELTHALSGAVKNNNMAFYYFIEEQIQGVQWGGRVKEGLTDLYAFAAMGGKLDKHLFWEFGNLRSFYCIRASLQYPYGQAVAILLCNALGREAVAKAFFGSDEDYSALCRYYESLSDLSFDEFLGLGERFAAHSETTGEQLNREAATAAGKRYMDAIISLCEKRAESADPEEFYREMATLRSYSPVLYDDGYMEQYFEKIQQLMDDAMVHMNN